MANRYVCRILVGIAGAMMPCGTHAADRLPFPDGSYVTDKSYCRLNRDQIYARYEFGIYDIRGRKISNYETFCSIRGVRTSGSSIRFAMECESEGEKSVTHETWTKLGPASFRTANHTFTGCGKFLK